MLQEPIRRARDSHAGSGHDAGSFGWTSRGASSTSIDQVHPERRARGASPASVGAEAAVHPRRGRNRLKVSRSRSASALDVDRHIDPGRPRSSR